MFGLMLSFQGEKGHWFAVKKGTKIYSLKGTTPYLIWWIERQNQNLILLVRKWNRRACKEKMGFVGDISTGEGAQLPGSIKG
jgi:hypothetical protein